MQDSGKFQIEKCINPLYNPLKNIPDEFISEKHGEAILKWIDKGSAVDFRIKELRAECTEFAMNGDIERLRKWYIALAENDKAAVNTSGLLAELQAVAQRYSDTADGSQTSKPSIGGLDDIVGATKNLDLPQDVADVVKNPASTN